MRLIKNWRPAPGTVLGMIALFISLGGVSYGVAAGSIDSREIKNNTVGSKDIRNSTVLGKDTKNGSLTGSDVKNDGLTGNDVLESSLGTVPSANTANNANTANTANFASVAGATTGLSHASVTASDGGPDKTLFTINGFQVFLHCETAGADDTAVYVKNVSAGENAAVDGQEATDHGIPENDDLDQGEQFLVNASAGANIDESGHFAAYGSNGSLTGTVSVASAIPSTGAVCAANGYGTG